MAIQRDTLARVGRSEKNTNPSVPTAPTTWPPYTNPPCAMRAKLLQSCLTLCDLMHCSLPGSSVHGILQARVLVSSAFPLPGDLSNPGIQPVSLMPPALPGRFFTTSATWEGHAIPLSSPFDPEFFPFCPQSSLALRGLGPVSPCVTSTQLSLPAYSSDLAFVPLPH